MDLKPVKDTHTPQYPRKEEVAPERIKVSIPLRWAKSPAAKVALGALAAMTLTGCVPIRTAGVPIAPETATEETATESPIISDIVMGETMSPTIRVAPLFVHGDGLGAFGCVMVAPPAFLSEDEALAVINNVAKEYGLTFTTSNGPAIDYVLQPVTDVYGSNEPAPSDTYVSFTPDFTDEEHGVSIEFVSTQDVQEWNHGEQAISVGTYNTQDAAAQLSEALEAGVPQNYENTTIGVVYDPCESAPDESGEDWENAEQQARALSVEQLSAQVRDFCEWLLAQGII